MTDKIVFVCLILSDDEGEQFSWSKMFENVYVDDIYEEIRRKVLKYPDLINRTVHVQNYGFDEDEFEDNNYQLLIDEAVYE